MKTKIIFILSLAIILFASCSSSNKIAQKGWSQYNSGNYKKANKFFKKALLRKGSKEEAFIGNAYVEYKYGDFSSAERYIAKAYSMNSKSSYNTYLYARFACLNGNTTTGMRLLFEIPRKGKFEYYRKQAATDVFFDNLRTNPKFSRYISGYRRIKIEPYSGYSNIDDGLFNSNDLFAIVENNKKIILVTNVVQEHNKASWYNNYVVFDYPINSGVNIFLMDEDVIEHDMYIKRSGPIYQCDDFHFKYGGSYIKVRISDTEESPYTTGTNLPSEVSLSELALGIGMFYLVTQTTDLDNSFMVKLIDCSTNAGISYFVENPLYAAAIEEAYESVKQDRGYSFVNLSKETVKGLVIKELEENGYKELANMLSVADYLYCLFDN